MLSQYQTNQLQRIIDIVVRASSPEKIFLLGAAYNNHTEESIFTGQPVTGQHVTHYYLMVLTHANDERCFDALQDIMESRCRHATPCTVFIEAIHIFNEWLGTGHPFACRITEAGLLVYDAGTTSSGLFCQSDEVVDPIQLRKEFMRWDNHVTEFLVGTELYLLRKQFGLAAFLLHQAAEHAFTILLKAMTGYRAGTHNLDKLIRYCKPFSARLAQLFPRHNEKENNLFQLLQRAYVHGRYRDDYIIKEKELQTLIERIKRLQIIVRELAEGKMSIK